MSGISAFLAIISFALSSFRIRKSGRQVTASQGSGFRKSIRRHSLFRRFFRRILTPPMVVLVALYLWLEEWLWVRTAAIMARLARAPFMRALERRLAALPPWAALLVFFLPGTLLLPVKIAAVFLVGSGRFIAGALLITAAKLLGTAIVARLFTVCRPALLTVGWFRRLHDWVLAFRERIFARIRAHPAWRSAVRLKEDMKARVKHLTRNWKPGMLSRRWRAIGLRQKRRGAHKHPRPRDPNPVDP